MTVDEAVRKAKQDYGVSETLEPSELNSLLDVLQQTVGLYPEHPAVTSLGNTLSYTSLDELSTAFAAYLKHST